jgi:dephospho-CoA kinase
LVKEILVRRYNCYHVTLSEVIRGELEKKKGLINRGSLQDMGNELRKKYGGHILALLSIEYLPRDKELIIIDGIRNPAEGQWLRKKFGAAFVWIGIDAPEQTRFERVQARASFRDPKTLEEFITMDKRDKGEGEPEWGQQVARCMEQVDYKIINDGTAEQLGTKVEEMMKQIIV